MGPGRSLSVSGSAQSFGGHPPVWVGSSGATLNLGPQVRQVLGVYGIWWAAIMLWLAMGGDELAKSAGSWILAHASATRGLAPETSLERGTVETCTSLVAL